MDVDDAVAGAIGEIARARAAVDEAGREVGREWGARAVRTRARDGRGRARGTGASTSREAVASRRRREAAKRFDPRAEVRRRAVGVGVGTRDASTSWDDESDDAAAAAEHERAWRAFEARMATDGAFVATHDDVPWPRSGAWIVRFALRDADADVARVARALARRWHPDKFAQRFGGSLDARDRERIIARVMETYQSARQFIDATTR